MSEGFTGFVMWVVGIFVLIGLAFLAIWGFNSIRIWTAETGGKAKLAEARYSKQVQLEEAKANLDSQKLNSQAEVERAKGAAQAIEIEAGKLTDNYIRYLWVQQQSNLNDKTVIYVPTEGGIPIMESGRGTN